MILDALHSASRAAAIAAGVQALRHGELLGLPTETVYGLGADADNSAAVAHIFAAKGRPSDHPLIVHLAAFDAGMSGVDHYCVQVPAFARQLMAAFWPGPLTLILPRRPEVGAAAAGGQDAIGVRCPSHPVAQEVLNALRKPAPGQAVVWGVAAPSANRFGRVSPTTAAHVQSELGEDLLVLDGGACAVGIESTIIDCSRGAPVLLRPGGISSAQVEAACGQKLLSQEELHARSGPAPRASGTLQAHYAPQAKVRLMPAGGLQQALDLLGPELAQKAVAHPSIAVYARSPVRAPAHHILLRRMPTDAAQAAHELFAVLRELDAQQVRVIWVETPPPEPAWDGVRDRLQRASAA